MLRATYEFDPREAAQALAVQLSTGLPGAGGPLAADVVGTEAGRVTVELGWDAYPADPDLIMAALVAGESMEVDAWRRCRLVDLEIPTGFLPGPALGAGPGWRLGVIVKPSVGLGPEEVARVTATAFEAGATLVKDDELAMDSPWCPLIERVRAVAEVLPRGATYLANVGGSPAGLLERARRAVDAGATGVLVSPLVQGLGSLLALRRAQLGVPVLAHRVGSGMLVRNPNFGATGAVVTGLLRACGADMVIAGGFGSKLFETDPEVEANLAAARHPGSAGLRPAWALLGGGLGPADALGQLQRAGGDGLVVLLGSSAYRHPGGLSAAVAEAAEAMDGPR